MIGILFAVMIAILLIGIVLKLVKIAVMLALCVGIYLAARNMFKAGRAK